MLNARRTRRSFIGATVVLMTTPYYVPGWPMKVDLKRSCFNEAWINRYNELQREVQGSSDGKAAILNHVIIH